MTTKELISMLRKLDPKEKHELYVRVGKGGILLNAQGVSLALDASWDGGPYVVIDVEEDS